MCFYVIWVCDMVCHITNGYMQYIWSGPTFSPYKYRYANLLDVRVSISTTCFVFAVAAYMVGCWQCWVTSITTENAPELCGHPHYGRALPSQFLSHRCSISPTCSSKTCIWADNPYHMDICYMYRSSILTSGKQRILFEFIQLWKKIFLSWDKNLQMY